MGYLLFGLEVLVAGWLAMALLAVFTGRRRSAIARGVLDVGTWVIVLVPFAAATFAGLLLRARDFRPFWFWPLVAIDVLLFVGAVILWMLGRRAGRRWQAAKARGEEPAEVDAQVWSLSRLGIALAIVLLLASATFRSLDAAVQQQLSDVRTEAETLAVSVMPTPVPERENAAGLYRQLGEYFREVWWPEFYTDAREELGFRELPSDHVAVDFASSEIGELMAEHRGARQLILEASKRPSCNFGRDYTRPSYGMLLVEIQYIRECTVFMAIDARHRALTGDQAGALANVQAIFLMANHAASDPLLVPMLVAIYQDRVATRTLEFVLAAAPIEATELAALEIDPGVSQFYRLNRALRSEEAAMLSAFANLELHGPMIAEELRDIAEFGALFRVFLLPQDLAGYREFAREADSAIGGGMSLSDSLERVRDVRVQLDRSPPGIVTMLLTPSLEAAIASAVRGEAARRLARTGQALYLYRAEHGEFPDDLQKLTPDFLPFVPRDPFDGKPLQLRNTPRGCIVYCAGLDQFEVDQRTLLAGGQEESLEFECIAH